MLPYVEDAKRCATCGVDRAISDFHRRRATRRNKDGELYQYEHVAATCKPCEHAKKQAWRKTPEAQASERQFRQTNAKRRMWAQTPTGLESIRRYRASLRNLLRQSSADFKARGGTGEPSLTLAELSSLLDRYRTTCAYCRRALLRDAPVGHSQKLTLDHVVPIDRGGQHRADNVVPACHRCNTRKSVLHLRPLPPPAALPSPAMQSTAAADAGPQSAGV